MQTKPIAELQGIFEAVERSESKTKDWETLVSLKDWEIYTDGSAPIKNPGGAIGFSAVFVLAEDSSLDLYGGTPGRTTEPKTSNNRAEIAGVLIILEVLHKLKKDGQTLPSKVDIVCDSQYVVNCAQGRWKKHKNKDLWRRFDQLMCLTRQKKIKMNFRWTRAHVGTKWNERADVLAKEGAFLAIGKSSSDSEEFEAGQEDKSASQKELPKGVHYTLELFSEMKTKSSAHGTYRLATPKRERSETLEIEDILTLDEAEYQVLTTALDDLLTVLDEKDQDPKKFSLLVESTRDLVLKQIQGHYGVKAERLQPLHKKVSSQIRRFESVSWEKKKKQDLKHLRSW